MKMGFENPSGDYEKLLRDKLEIHSDFAQRVESKNQEGLDAYDDLADWILVLAQGGAIDEQEKEELGEELEKSAGRDNILTLQLVKRLNKITEQFLVKKQNS